MSRTTLEKLNRLARAMKAFRRGARDYSELRRKLGHEPGPWDGFPITSRAALDVFRDLGIELEITGTAVTRDPHIMVGNHVSWLDPIALSTFAPTSFVARADTQYWPFFGSGLKAFGTIFVQRKNSASRDMVRERIAQAIRKEGRFVGVFPEGHTSLAGMNWRRGVFQLAAKHQIQIQPFRVRYEPARVVAYIDDDTFVTQFWRLLGETKIKAWIEVGEARLVRDPEATRAECEAWTAEWGKLMTKRN